jgi:hypothetical protein
VITTALALDAIGGVLAPQRPVDERLWKRSGAGFVSMAGARQSPG